MSKKKKRQLSQEEKERIKERYMRKEQEEEAIEEVVEKEAEEEAIEEEAIEEEESLIDKHSIDEFCSAMDLSSYHRLAFTKIFGKGDKRTIEEWKKYLVENNLISKELLK